MGRISHRVVEAAEDGIVVSAFGGEAETLHVFDADLSHVRLGLQDLHRLRNEPIEGHRARVGGPVQQVRGDIRRDEFEDLYRSPLELVAKRLRVRVDRGLGCAIGGSWRHRNKGKKATPAKKAAKAKKVAKKSKPAKEPKAARTGSKSEEVIALLKRKGGATMAEIVALTGWQKHTTRGWVSGFLGKKMGITVESFKSDKGERTYRINQ